MEINYPSNESPKIPPIKWGAWIVPVIIIALAFSAASSMFYQVETDEKGVVQRFGQYVRTADEGLHFKLPFGIETVKNIKVTRVFKEEFGFRTVASGVRSTFAGRSQYESDSGSRLTRQSTRGGNSRDPYIAEKVMLTGDLNVAVVEWIVQYTVKDPVRYAFKIEDPRETIRVMSEATMRLVIGDKSINQVLTAGREEIQMNAHKMLQDVLDSYEAGVDIRNVILQDVTPPDEVKPSFNEVNEARQEKEKLINQAWEEYNRVIPRAAGQAEQQIRAAEGYALERVNRAQGDADRFLLTLEEYKKAPQVTRKRLYLEMAEKVFPEVNDKLMLDETGNGMLPLLSLNKEKGGQVS